MSPSKTSLPTNLAIEEFIQALAAALKRIRAEQQPEALASNAQLPVATQPQPTSKEHLS